MLRIFREFIVDIPILHVVQENQEMEKLPTVFFLHGFTSAKEHNLHYAYYLAEKGFRVILPEANLHGERAKDMSDASFLFSFWDIVIQSIKEVDVIKQEYVKREYIDETRIGMAGTSMGAITTLGALTQHEWIKVAVSLMGAPAYVTLAKAQIQMMKNKYANYTEKLAIDEQIERLKSFDLSLQIDTLNKRPLLFWHGKQDPIVPFQNAYMFYEEAKSHYGSNIDSLQFIADERGEHKVSRKGVLETVHWFEKFL
ncbi:MAG TPA: prolyl oligopeptidase family serine peptidase [Massilibacterium sp.]|nr:prolyl oligopeptidase family serine peptidase [Massilibacterium sp.]